MTRATTLLVRSFAIACVASTAHSLAGCCLVSERAVRGDDGGPPDAESTTDADLDVDARSEAGADLGLEPGQCVTTCEPVAELGGPTTGLVTGEVAGLIDALRIGDVLGVLVITTGPLDPNVSTHAYTLLRFNLRTGIANKTAEIPELYTVEGGLVGGALYESDGRFAAVVLRSDTNSYLEGIASLATVTWESDNRVARVADLGPFASESGGLPPCECRRVGAVIADDARAIAAIGFGDGLFGARLDLGAGALDVRRDALVTFDGAHAGTISVSGIVLEGESIAVAGGGARLGGEPTTAYAAWGALDDLPLTARALPGAPFDPPPRVARVGATPVVWRFVSDPSDIARGAIVHGRLARGGAIEEVSRVGTAGGAEPTATTATHDDARAALVYMEPSGVVGSSVRVWMSDGEPCATTTAHHALDFPRAAYSDEHGLVATMDDAGLFVVVLGATADGGTHAFFAPSCALHS